MKTATKKTSTNKNATTGRQAAPQASTNGKQSKAAFTKSQSRNEEDTTAGKEKQETRFEKLLLDLMKDIYWAEEHLVEALPKMAEAATTAELQEAFEDHLHQTQRHVKRLEKAFSLLGKKAESKKCAAMEGLVKEAEEVIKSTDEGSMTRDAGLIISAQKVEHYEIATYGSLVQVALTLGHDELADLFEKTLNEEERTDHRLTVIAESEVNPLADQEDEPEEVYAEMEEEVA